MKIIIDGCDLVGKSSLIEKLKKHFSYKKNISYLHFSYRDRTDYGFYNTFLDKEDFISDRHFIDEMVYPKFFNRRQGITEEEFVSLLKKCKNKDIKIIILTVDDETLLERSKERQEEKAVADNLLEINREFKKLSKKYNLPLFDTTKNSLEEIIDFLEEKINE